MNYFRTLRRSLAPAALTLALSLAVGGTASAQGASGATVTPKAKPQAGQPVPPADQRSPGRSILSFDPLTDLLRPRQGQLVDHRTYRELERDRFGGDTIDPTGRYDSFFTAPELRPTQRLGQYSR